MSSRGQFNTKSPTIKRILKEASELANNASPDYHAEPLEDNLFEWHFTLRGPPAPSPYAEGLYHGRIVLPPSYPLRPPSFRFLTPTGRFEVNREICLSISGHHEETWQPAWGIRTAMVAIRSFMDTDAKGQVGGLECNEGARRRMAAESGGHRCAVCGRTNGQIMKEREEMAARQAEGERKAEEVVPDESRLAYRDELEKSAENRGSDGGRSHLQPSGEETSVTASSSAQRAPERVSLTSQTSSSQRSGLPTPRDPSASPSGQQASSSRVQQQQLRPRARPPQATDHGVPAWLDKAIWGVFAALVFMIARKIFFA